jgi:predicted acylesterase/phospholipase RssA/CRP-like cAMP-binding protein
MDHSAPGADDGGLAEKLAGMAGFADLGVGQLEEIAPRFAVLNLQSNETLVEQGQKADSMFVVLDGRLSVTVSEDGEQDRVIGTLIPGNVVGEVAVVAGGRRAATVKAEIPTRVAMLDSEGVGALLSSHPEAAAAFALVASRRLREVQLADQMASLFADLEPEARQALADGVQWSSLSAGETLFTQGDPGDSAYLLVSGRLLVSSEQTDGSSQVVGEVGPGELVGEYALIMDRARSATVLAKKDADLARIPRDMFMSLIKTHSEILLALTRTIIRRSEASTVQAERDRSQNRSIAVVVLDVGSDWFCETLHTQLCQHGEAIHLDADRIGALLHKPGIAQSTPGDPAQIRLLQWLGNVESTHGFVLYQTDPAYTAWTERAIRQADEVIFVGHADSGPHQREIEIESARLRKASHQRASLVLLHDPDSQRPRGTAAWLAARSVDAVYHLRRDNEADAARLGRILAGNALGLVLGGGGARGFAHLGVIRALEEFDVPIDMIGGVSIGAVIAQLPARGFNAAECLSIVRERFHSLLDYTLPVTSLLSGKRINNSIEIDSGDWDIEDMWRPFYCVSTNLTTAAEVHHRSGSLARAVRASLSMPGILPPVPAGSELLVDGGVMNNLPIDVMRTLNPTGPIIAVGVSPPRGPTVSSDYGLSVSGWKILASRWLPGRARMDVPRLGSTMLAAMLVGAGRSRSAQLSAKLADLFLDIKVTDINLLDFERVDEVADIGYTQSLSDISAWSRGTQGAK